jgi:hypothetical protein
MDSVTHANNRVIVMPSKSAKQHRLMEMVAHDPAAAKRTGIPQKVAREFVEADKGKRFAHKSSAKHMAHALHSIRE